MKHPLTLVAVAVGAFAVILLAVTGRLPLGGAKEDIMSGRMLYAEHCASCHGANLEGQPDWKQPLPTGRLPAPPHDATGHTWHHPDGVLYRITREGTAAVVGGGYQSDMPGFGDILPDSDIRAVLDYIKSTWPERERDYQKEISRREQKEGSS
ncbi:c-type cytochrome [Neoaquamicrobium sediminum]|uniref:c-type cytochrome n=1 Tax=Neoaquamicrobium sediminum TaxID=1849104 RepID=UPI001565ED8C|nr:cytochrome c [Mesorhizobium sediminum]NRC56491.1 cytochrome c [Mesorhizobium sediminum]